MISLLPAAVAVWAVVYQVGRARFQQEIDLLVRQEADFFGDEKCQQRSLAASGILRGDFSEAEDILDFFETIALYIRKDALDQYMVWHTFSYWIYGYFEATRSHIAAEQASDPLRWKDLCDLIPRMRDLHQKELLKAGAKEGSAALKKAYPDLAAVQAFLSEEALEGSAASSPLPASPRTPPA
ncbi:MAG: DUF4760 domain-containing protein [Acidobacteriaceae bacterium]